jgi:predicted transcriptional regulator of viral defense system
VVQVREQVKKVRDFLRRTPVADIRSISMLTRSENYAWVLMNYLVRKGEARRIMRGYYTVHEDPSLLVYCLQPAYLGLQDAMSFHNLWEQETVPVVVTCRRVRTGIRRVMGSNAVVRRISRKYFFGYQFYPAGEFSLPVSDVEKTFVDMVYFGEMRSELVGRFRPRLNLPSLREYLERYPPTFREKVLGFLS